MRVLVSGSNGFLGSNLVERLIDNNHLHVRCLVRPGSNLARLDRLRLRHPEGNFEVFRGSLSDVDSAAAALSGVDLIYHVAAAMSGSAADMFLNTVVTSRNLISAHEKICSTARIVLVSSFGVYRTADLMPGAVVNEKTALESHPERRDIYSYSKLRQELLFREYHERSGLPLVVIRPGVIYGPGGPAISSRVGLSMFGLFLHLGSNNPIPLTYVSNCADAIAIAGETEGIEGEVFNVHDDDLPSCSAYLKRYKRDVERIRSISIPYRLLYWIAGGVERYNQDSHGQLPAIFTHYKVQSSWKRTSFDNTKLKSIGWAQAVPTDEGLRRTFESMQSKRLKPREH